MAHRFSTQRILPALVAIAMALQACALATIPELDSGRRTDTGPRDASDSSDTSTVTDTAPGGCLRDGDCHAPTPFCDTTTQQCVACRGFADCPVSTPRCVAGTCVPSCTTNADCSASACQTCSSGACVSTCASGETCTAGTCGCATGTRRCAAICIATSACCTNADCTGGATCSVSGGSCSCPAGMRTCGSSCIAGTACCSNADCASGMTCPSPGSTCQCSPGSCGGACGSCGSGQTCSSGHCVACGGVGQPCCSGSCSSGVCSGGSCVACGGVGQPCCAGSSCSSGACSGGTCIACGGVGEPCCGGSSCTAGACLSGRCAVFGGAYETNDPTCGGCHDANPFTSGCSCPSGTSPIATRTVNDCAGSGAQIGATINFCRAPSYTGGDFAGAYQIDDPVSCGAGCRTPNPYTGACSCPGGSSAVEVRTLVGACGGIIGSHIGVCMNTSAARISFGGVYEVDDAGAPGSVGCRTSNPYTGDCSCPSGTSAHGYRIEIDTPSFIGAVLFVCTP